MMIKNLLNADEEIASRPDESAVETAVQTAESVPPTAPLVPDTQLLLAEPSKPFEIPDGALFFKVEPVETPLPIEKPAIEIPPTANLPLIEEVTANAETLPQPPETANETETVAPLAAEISSGETFLNDETEKKSDDWNTAETPPVIEFKPPSKAETIRRSGLAWSAGIIFFGSVVFTMILGWFADLLLGSSPWGLVGGIVLGALIGFIQFFRITAQIFKE